MGLRHETGSDVMACALGRAANQNSSFSRHDISSKNVCLTALGWERIPLLINNVKLGLGFCFFSVTEAQKWSFFSNVSISDAFKFDTLAGCAYVCVFYNLVSPFS